MGKGGRAGPGEHGLAVVTTRPEGGADANGSPGQADGNSNVSASASLFSTTPVGGGATDSGSTASSLVDLANGQKNAR